MKAWEEICTRRGAGAIAVDITIGDSRVITVSYRGDQPTAGADAVRLILAAPAMREALAGLLDAIKRGVYFEDGGLDGACEKARAALALATALASRRCRS